MLKTNQNMRWSENSRCWHLEMRATCFWVDSEDDKLPTAGVLTFPFFLGRQKSIFLWSIYVEEPDKVIVSEQIWHYASCEHQHVEVPTESLCHRKLVGTARNHCNMKWMLRPDNAEYLSDGRFQTHKPQTEAAQGLVIKNKIKVWHNIVYILQSTHVKTDRKT